jgi:hypothetical protein
MGEVATKEVIEIIQVVFTNLAQGFVHICYTQHEESVFTFCLCSSSLTKVELAERRAVWTGTEALRNESWQTCSNLATFAGRASLYCGVN